MGTMIDNAISELVSSYDNMCVFVSDLTDGSFEISGSDFLGGLIDNDSEPILQLCYNHKVHPADNKILNAFCGDILNGRTVPVPETRFSVNFRSDNGSGGYSWLKLTVYFQLLESHCIKRVVGMISGLNSVEMLNKDIIDSFSSDKHPDVFINLVKQMLSRNDDRRAAFIQFDIDKFKIVNSRYGGDTGSEILSFISGGLDAICTGEQYHMRMSADVFMIAMLINDESEIKELIRKIDTSLSSYGDIHYKFVFGVYIVEDKTMPVRKMGDYAGLARTSVKGSALCNVGYYSDSMISTLDSRKSVEDRMEEALANNEFVMYLQPKYSIETGQIIGSEALVRWIHPERGIVPPMEFIPVFEQNGFVVKIDRFMWEEAFKAVRSWIDRGYEPIPISVNISRIHLTSEDFINCLDGLAEKYGIDKRYIETEITETVDSAGHAEMIKKLKEHGFVLLMDDFGSGYSSLNMLKSTPFDVIKIDRDFLSEFMLSDRGKKIIAHTISMSRDIGLDMVAEGVETKEQAEFLSGCGCDVAQGFYYSRPITLADFEKLAFGV